MAKTRPKKLSEAELCKLALDMKKVDKSLLGRIDQQGTRRFKFSADEINQVKRWQLKREEQTLEDTSWWSGIKNSIKDHLTNFFNPPPPKSQEEIRHELYADIRHRNNSRRRALEMRKSHGKK